MQRFLFCRLRVTIEHTLRFFAFLMFFFFDPIFFLLFMYYITARYNSRKVHLQSIIRKIKSPRKLIHLR